MTDGLKIRIEHDETREITFGEICQVQPSDYTITTSLTWLDVRGGLAIAHVVIAASGFAARSYSAKMLIGPDGQEMLEASLIDSFTVSSDGLRANKLHPFSEADVIEAARKTWQEQRATTEP